MKRLLSIPVIIALISTVISFAGFAINNIGQPAIAPGDVLSVSGRTAMYGFEEAMREAPGTARYLSPDGQFVLWSWTWAGNQAWAFMARGDAAVLDFFKGNVTATASWDELKAVIEALGWKLATPQEVGMFLQARAVVGAWAVISRGLAVPILIPASLFDDPLQRVNPKVAA